MTSFLLLTNGEYALVDDKDYKELCQYTWQQLPNGYVAHATTVEGQIIYLLLHRAVMEARDDILVDHRDGNRLDNRRANLRTATHIENARNRAPCEGQQYKGITPTNGKWKARIKVGGTSIYLGSFDEAKDAALAYDAAARRLFGEFARLNFPTRPGPR